MFKVEENKIYVPKSELDLKNTLECGQFFRYDKDGEVYVVRSGNKTCLCRKDGDFVTLETDDTSYFIRFFDLERDVKRICRELARFEELAPMLSASEGLRILRQPLFETIITFVISANNNMPRIKSTVGRLCELFDGAFPSPQELASLSTRTLESLGCGYRAPYIEYDAKLCAETDFLLKLESAPTDTALVMLNALKGVGPKVADCVALFALARLEVCPVDTWIFNKERVGLENERQVRQRLCKRYGAYAGYAQQIIFNYYAVLNRK